MNNQPTTWQEEKIWESIVLKVDNVGVVIKQKDNKWFLIISGTQEKVVDITDLFSQTLSSQLKRIEEKVGEHQYKDLTYSMVLDIINKEKLNI